MCRRSVEDVRKLIKVHPELKNIPELLDSPTMRPRASSSWRDPNRIRVLEENLMKLNDDAVDKHEWIAIESMDLAKRDLIGELRVLAHRLPEPTVHDRSQELT